jgi:hypothetical protein
MTFQYVLLIVLGLFLAYVLALRRQALVRKALVIMFILAMLVFTIRPEWSTAIARLVGVGRGVDLLFYLSHMVLFFIAFMYYLRFKDMELRFTRLVRQLALESARHDAQGQQAR